MPSASALRLRSVYRGLLLRERLLFASTPQDYGE
jgi:hypothetical protein